MCYQNKSISDHQALRRMRLAISVVVGLTLPFSLLAKVPFANSPEEIGFDSGKLESLSQSIQTQINDGYPSMTVLVMRDGKIGYFETFGDAQRYDEKGKLSTPSKATKSTLYDLASNSKMYATNFALQKLVSEGKLDINQTLQYYLPNFRDLPGDKIKGKDQLRVIDLLKHTAGFAPDPQYPNREVAGKLYSQDRKTTEQMINITPLEYEPGTQNVYSDVDYMLLGILIEKITNLPLDQYIETQIYQPLGLTQTKFNPLQKGFDPSQFAATEIHGNTRDGVIHFENIRTKTIRGEVHDEKAFYSMDGVSGHAGLFSTAEELATLVQVMHNNGTYQDVTIFSPEVAKEFRTAYQTDGTYGLGWRVHNKQLSNTFGDKASAETYGHTGWTGTMTLIDPINDVQIVLLGNRPHSPVANPQENPNVFEAGLLPISKYSWVANQVYDALLEQPKPLN